MPIDLTKFRDRVLNRRRDDHEEALEDFGDATAEEPAANEATADTEDVEGGGRAENDTDPAPKETRAENKKAIERRERTNDETENSPEVDGEDSDDSGQRFDGTGPGFEDMSGDEGRTASQFDRLLPEPAEEQVGNLTVETESVRTTFRLGREAEALFDRLSARTGSSKKELLGSALRLSQSGWEKSPDIFEQTAESLQIEDASRTPMAIAPRTREGLNDLRDESGIARDQIVEVGIRLAQAAFKKEIRRRIIPHLDVLADLGVLYQEVEKVQMKLTGHKMRYGEQSSACDRRDPITGSLYQILHMLIEMREAIEEELESGEPMGEYREFP